MVVRRNRFNETWHRLRDWDGGQTKSEMLSWQLIAADGYTRIIPSLPRGGPDGGKDARCERDGQPWVMASYFAPSGQQKPSVIKKKLLGDMEGAKKNGAVGIALVTNQEISLADRETWSQLDPDLEVDIFDLDRITRILQDPKYAQTREEFLDIVGGPPPMLIKAEVFGTAHGFTDDASVLDFYVAHRKKSIRARSEEGHQRVRQEAERRRREAAAANAPYGLGSSLVTSEAMQKIMDSFAPKPVRLNIPGLYEVEPEPLTDEQIEDEVQQYRDELLSRWPDCMDYLAGVAWHGLRFRIENEAKSFLGDVQVILTFHNAGGRSGGPRRFSPDKGSRPELAASKGSSVLHRFSRPGFSSAV